MMVPSEHGIAGGCEESLAGFWISSSQAFQPGQKLVRSRLGEVGEKR
jgi:hypothetical protein